MKLEKLIKKVKLTPFELARIRWAIAQYEWGEGKTLYKGGQPPTVRFFDTSDNIPPTWERCYIFEALRDGLISVYFDTENRMMVLVGFASGEVIPF